MNRRSFLSLLTSVPLLGRLAPKPYIVDKIDLWADYPENAYLTGLPYCQGWAQSEYPTITAIPLTIEQARELMDLDPLDVQPDEVVVKDA